MLTKTMNYMQNHITETEFPFLKSWTMNHVWMERKSEESDAERLTYSRAGCCNATTACFHVSHTTDSYSGDNIRDSIKWLVKRKQPNSLSLPVSGQTLVFPRLPPVSGRRRTSIIPRPEWPSWRGCSCWTWRASSLPPETGPQHHAACRTGRTARCSPRRWTSCRCSASSSPAGRGTRKVRGLTKDRS